MGSISDEVVFACSFSKQSSNRQFHLARWKQQPVSGLWKGIHIGLLVHFGGESHHHYTLAQCPEII